VARPWDLSRLDGSAGPISTRDGQDAHQQRFDGVFAPDPRTFRSREGVDDDALHLATLSAARSARGRPLSPPRHSGTSGVANDCPLSPGPATACASDAFPDPAKTNHSTRTPARRRAPCADVRSLRFAESLREGAFDLFAGV